MASLSLYINYDCKSLVKQKKKKLGLFSKKEKENNDLYTGLFDSKSPNTYDT